MSAHTPGPWHLEPAGPLGSKFTIPIFVDRGGGVRTSIARTEWATVEGLANARLIAAAPEMYEALRAIVKRHDAQSIEASGMEGVTCGCAYCAEAQAAIAKAEGRS